VTGIDQAPRDDDHTLSRWELVEEYVAIGKAAETQFVITRLLKYLGDLEAFRLSVPVYRGREAWVA
jgi:hypothetical protein